MNEKELNSLITPNTTIGEIVAANYHTAGVFHRYGLDFCCGGGKRRVLISFLFLL